MLELLGLPKFHRRPPAEALVAGYALAVENHRVGALLDEVISKFLVPVLEGVVEASVPLKVDEFYILVGFILKGGRGCTTQ